MADELKNAEKINGAKFRSFEKADKTWSDPFTVHQFYSRTFLPKGTKFIEAQEESEMIAKIKAAKCKFTEANLSKETVAKLEKEKITIEKSVIEETIKKTK